MIHIEQLLGTFGEEPEEMEQFKSSLFFLMAHGLIKSGHFSSNSTSIMSGSDFEEVLRLPPPGNPSREKKSPFGCHTMFPQPAQRTIWFLYPTNCLLQAGQAPCGHHKVRISEILEDKFLSELQVEKFTKVQKFRVHSHLT